MQASYVGNIDASSGGNGLFGLGSLIGSGVSFLGGLFSNATNRKIAEQNMQLQREINSQNIAFQREANAQNIAFQQRENDITRLREDNAIQRAAADMTAAGLSKTLAAGQPASAAALSAPSVDALKAGNVSNQFRYESALQKLNLGSILLDMQAKKEQLDIDRKLGEANVEKLNAEATGQNISNDQAAERFQMEKTLNQVTVDKYKIENELNAFEFKLKKEYGGKEIQAKIDNLLAETRFKNMSTRKAQHEITNIIKTGYKIDKETEQLVKNIVYLEKQSEAYDIDIAYAKKVGLPVGKIPTGIFGQTLQMGSWLDAQAHPDIPEDDLFKYYYMMNSKGTNRVW